MVVNGQLVMHVAIAHVDHGSLYWIGFHQAREGKGVA